MLWCDDMCLITIIKVLATLNGCYDYHDDRKRLSQQTLEYAKVTCIETELHCLPWVREYKNPHEFGYSNDCGKFRQGSQVDQ